MCSVNYCTPFLVYLPLLISLSYISLYQTVLPPSSLRGLWSVPAFPPHYFISSELCFEWIVFCKADNVSPMAQNLCSQLLSSGLPALTFRWQFFILQTIGTFSAVCTLSLMSSPPKPLWDVLARWSLLSGRITHYEIFYPLNICYCILSISLCHARH